MADERFKSITPSRKSPPELDTSVAHPARVYDYWLGGKDNYPADRAAAEQVIAVRPSIRFDIRANRAFLGRAVRYLAGEAGIRQFLDIGTGIPTVNNTHEVAQAEAPESRIVYVDNDPIVLVHARALLTSSPEGATSYLDADLRTPAPILQAAAETLDFSQPVAVMLIGIMHLISDEEDPYGTVATLLAAVPSGSYLALTHPAKDISAEAAAAGAQAYNQAVSTRQTRRTFAETARFFDALELVDPGLVQVHRWRPDPGAPDLDREVSGYGAIGRTS
ncbi:MAG: SAM-dependent methyltransferase [Actinomycetota bacterium]|nr:SAM-dependent methyltransferase [Actinomycetota bacterium]